MKAYHNLIVLILVLLLIIPYSLFAQKEMSITTSSKEALKLFFEGRDKVDNIERDAGFILLDKAIELDPDFAMAYIYRGGRRNTEKAVSLIDKVSEGEKHFILWFQAYYNSNGEEIKKQIDALLKLYPDDKRFNFTLA